MNTRLVVDTSVIIKWLNQNNENNVEKADKIMQDALQGKYELFTPELAKYELGNVLLKGKQLTPTEALISLSTAYALPIHFIGESEEIAKNTFAIASKLNTTYYDASFISLAQQYDATLVTENTKHQGKAKNIIVKALKDF